MAETEGPDLDRIGIFKEMGYLHGVEHVPFAQSFNEESKKGKQMQTQGTKLKAGNQDGYFDKKFLRAFEGEAYADPIRMRRKFRLEDAKKNRPAIFRPTSPTKKACGSGSNYGTFQKYTGETVPSFSPAERPFIQVPCTAKNCLVNPVKKGSGYGYANVSISKDPPYFAEGEYEKLKTQGKPASHVEAPRISTTFVLNTHEKDYFDPNPFFTANPQPMYREPPEKVPIKVPFIPPNPTKKDGGMKAGCLEKYPEHMNFASTGPGLQFRTSKTVTNSSGKMFLPWHGPRPYPIQSTVATNVKRSMNIKNFQQIKGVVYIKN